MTIEWTKNDEKRVKAILTKVAADMKGWQGIADRLKLKGKSKRATAEAWARRGRVPIKHVKAIAALAVECGMKVRLTELNPEAYYLEETA